MIRINLLPYREEKKTSIQRQAVTGVLALCLFVLLLITFHLHIRQGTTALNTEVDSARARLSALTGVTGHLEQFQQNKELLQKKIGIIQNLERDRNYSVHIMDELASRISPQREWLTSITKEGDTLRIEGVAIDNPAIAHFMKRLEESPYIGTVDLVSSKQRTIAGAKLMGFVLLCTAEKG